MTQSTVLEVLKKKQRWVNTKELMAELNINGSTINCALRKMLKYGEVVRRTNRMDGYHYYEYKSK